MSLFIQDGLAILGSGRTGANAYPNEDRFVVPADENGVASYIGGQTLCIATSLQNNLVATGTAPANVFPAGWTGIASAISASLVGMRSSINCFAKILQTGDFGDTVVGMNGTDNGRIMVQCFRFSRRIQGFQALVVHRTLDDIGVSATITRPAGTEDMNTLVWAHALSETAISNSHWVVSNIAGSPHVTPPDANDDTGAVASASRAYYDYNPVGMLANSTYSGTLADRGTFNGAFIGMMSIW